MRLKILALVLVIGCCLTGVPAVYAQTSQSCADCIAPGTADSNGVVNNYYACDWSSIGAYGSCVSGTSTRKCQTTTASYCTGTPDNGGSPGGGGGGTGGSTCDTSGGACPVDCFDCGGGGYLY